MKGRTTKGPQQEPVPNALALAFHRARFERIEHAQLHALVHQRIHDALSAGGDRLVISFRNRSNTAARSCRFHSRAIVTASFT